MKSIGINAARVAINPKLSLFTQAMGILRAYSAPTFLPFPGYVFSDSAGTTPAVQDGPVGRINDYIGGSVFTSQTTSGYRPTLRKGVKNLLNTSNNLASAWWSTIGTVSKAGGTLLNLPAVGDGVYNIYSTGMSSLAGVDLSGALKLSGTGTISIGIVSNGGGDELHQITLTPTPTIYPINRLWSIGGPTYVGVKVIRTATDTATSVNVYDALAAVGKYTVTAMAPIPGGTPVSNGVGPYWLDFDGVQQYLQLSVVPFQVQDDQFCISAANTRNTTGGVIFGEGQTIGGPTYSLSGLSASYVSTWIGGSGTSSATGGSNVFGANTVISSTRKSGVGVTYAKGASVATDSTVAGTSTFDAAVIGALKRDVVAYYLSGAVYGVTFGKSTITDPNRKTIEKYLGGLVGVTIS